MRGLRLLSIAYVTDFIRTKLAGRPNPKAVIGNSSWIFFDKILRMGMGLIVEFGLRVISNPRGLVS
jgi:hypothetical protein